MSVIGGNTESKKIGVQIGVGGTHQDTEINNKGFLTLAVDRYDASGNPIYKPEGTWISSTVNLGDKFKDFGKLFLTENSPGSAKYAVLTRVSDDGNYWSDWVALAMDGAIQSDTKQYIQVRVDLFAGFVIGKIDIGDFKDEDSAELFTPNEFIETKKGLKLKRDYDFDMTLDSSWAEEGSLHRKKIVRDEWLRIDGLEVI